MKTGCRQEKCKALASGFKAGVKTRFPLTACMTRTGSEPLTLWLMLHWVQGKTGFNTVATTTRSSQRDIAVISCLRLTENGNGSKKHHNLTLVNDECCCYARSFYS